VLNTSISKTTGMTPYLLLYGVYPRSNIDPAIAEHIGVEDFCEERRQWREEALETLKLAQAKVAAKSKNRPITLKPGDKAYVKVVRGTKPRYRLQHSTVFDPIKVGPFTIKSKVGSNAYELEVENTDLSKMHPVISAVHLEPWYPDVYDRQILPPPPLEIEGEQRYIVDRIIRKEQRRQPGDKKRKTYYRVRWMGYSPKEDNWLPEEELMEQIPEMVEAFNRRQISTKNKKKKRAS
jgi:hypothetical protein